MSLMKARRKFEVHLKTGMWIILIIFIVGIFFFYGSYTMRPERAMSTVRGAPSVLATVDGKPLTRERFEQIFAWTMRSMPFEQDVRTTEMIRSMVFEQAIGSILIEEAAKKSGLKVADAQVEQEIKRRVDAAMADKRKRGRQVTPEIQAAVEETIRAQEDAIRAGLLEAGVRAKVAGDVKVTDQDLLASFGEAKARHILVAFRPPTPGKKPRSDEEARKRAEELLSKIRGGASLAALAKTESDDVLSAAKDGDLGWMKYGESVKPFNDAIFSAEIGKVIGPVKTEFGYHIIKVEARRSSVPKDFQKNKEEYRKGLIQQRTNAAWGEFAGKLRDSAKVKITDPEMQAVFAMQKGQVDDAIRLFKQALTHADSLGPGVHAGIQYVMGNLLVQKNKLEDAAKAFEKAIEVATGSRGELYASLAETYLKLKKNKDAAEYARAATDEAPTDTAVSRRMERIYDTLGKKDLAEAEKKRRDQVEKELSRQMGPGAVVPIGP